MIKLFPVESMKYTVFENKICLDLFHQHKITLTSIIEQADIFLFRKLNWNQIRIFQETLREKKIEPKPILIWTHEPRYAKLNYDCIEIENFCSVHLMNLYTGNVYFSNYTFYGSGVSCLLNRISKVVFNKRPIVGLATYVIPEQQEFVLENINIDLSVKRQKLLYDGFQLGVLDIYGRNWPGSIAISESRGDGWPEAKLVVLKNYQFNVALENTSFDFYCTEKIWDSIKGGCLPIYSGYNNKIYDTFPKDSFVDFDDFSDNYDLLKFVISMDCNEYVRRMNRCVDVFNYLYETIDFDEEKLRAAKSVVERVEIIESGH